MTLTLEHFSTPKPHEANGQRIYVKIPSGSGNRGYYYRAWRQCKGCGEWDLAIVGITTGKFKSEHCPACTRARQTQKYDLDWRYSPGRNKRLYRRVCFICGKVEYVRVNADDKFASPYCRGCTQRARKILRDRCPLGYVGPDIDTPGCLDCPLPVCYYDILDIHDGRLEPHRVKRRTETK